MHLTGARRLWNSIGCVPRSKGCQVGHCSANADIQLRSLRHDHCCIRVVTEVHTTILHGMSVSDRHNSACGGVLVGKS